MRPVSRLFGCAKPQNSPPAVNIRSFIILLVCLCSTAMPVASVPVVFLKLTVFFYSPLKFRLIDACGAIINLERHLIRHYLRSIQLHRKHIKRCPSQNELRCLRKILPLTNSRRCCQLGYFVST